MNRIYQTICQYHMISPGDRVIAGVSGGADSVFLLRALAGYREQVPFTLFVVHVEHGIRGAESLADAAFVKGLCEALAVRFYLEAVDVTAYAREHRMTVEEAGRSVRYDCFEKLRKELGAEKIAVAHNQNEPGERLYAKPLAPRDPSAAGKKPEPSGAAAYCTGSHTAAGGAAVH